MPAPARHRGSAWPVHLLVRSPAEANVGGSGACDPTGLAGGLVCGDPYGYIQATGLDEAGRKQYLYSVKDFRTLHGTVLAAVELAREGAPRSEGAAERAIRAAIERRVLSLIE